MITSLNDWLYFLKVSQSAVGFPLVIAGLGLMLFGWRMWKVCVMLAFGVIGAVVAAMFVGPCDDQWRYALGGGIVLGALSYWPANHAVAALGGLIGGGIITHSLSELGLSNAALWFSGGAAFLACGAFAYLNRQYVVIIITAFLGATLLISGLTAWVMTLPSLYGTMRSIASDSVIVVPFLLLVPTVMSSFYQGAEVRRLCAEI